jgi:ferredoxin
MDLITLFRRQLKIRYWALPEKLNKSLHKLRYVITGVILVIVLQSFLIGASSLADVGEYVWLRGPFRPFTILLAPLETLVIPWVPPFGALADIGGYSLSFPYVGEIMAYGAKTGLALLVAIVFIISTATASFKFRRIWCRFCPTGISLAIMNRISHFKWIPFLHLNKEEEKCTKCGICKRVCPVQVTEVYDKKGGRIDTSMCTLCLRCVELCPYEGCLKVNLASKTLFMSQNWLMQEK